MTPQKRKWKSVSVESSELSMDKNDLSVEEGRHEKMERFKQTLQWLIEDRNISEAELSRLTHLSPATIHRLLYGMTDPRLTTLRAIASFFKIRIEQLIGDCPIPSVTQISKNSDKIFFSTPILIPFIEWDQLANYVNNISELTMGNWANWHVTTNDAQDNNLSSDLFATKLRHTAGNLLHAESVLVVKLIHDEKIIKIGDCVLGTNKSTIFVGQVNGSGDSIGVKGNTFIYVNKCTLHGIVVKCEIPCHTISRYTMVV